MAPAAALDKKKRGKYDDKHALLLLVARGGGGGGGRGKASKINHDSDDEDEPFFASDDDEIPDEFAKGDHLTWRKGNSFSDWTIIITVAKDNKTNKDKAAVASDRNTKACTFHVHKERLALGPRRSGYFARLLSGNFAESQENISRIELNEFAAKAFPQFLDYMYMTGQKMEFKTEKATALYSLGKYFDVQRLRHEAKQFILKDLSKKTWCTYCANAKLLQEDKILLAATK
jgi:BTB/POZ domain